MKIKSTTDYDLFKIVEGNRDVIKQHVKKLVSTLSLENLTEWMPIIVNEKMEVVDGQHRLAALKELQQPINYIVMKGADLSTVQMVNSSAKSWSLNDYVQSYIKRGNENYVVLDEYKKRYDLPLLVCAGLLMQNSREIKSEAIRDGSFVAKNIGAAEAIGAYISEIRKHVDKTLFQDKNFIRACVKVIKSDINRKQLLHKLRLYGPSIRKQAGTTDYLRELERIYNFRNQGEKIRLF